MNPLSREFNALVEEGCDPKYAGVALQLSNNDREAAAHLVQQMLRRRAELTATEPLTATDDSEAQGYATAQSAESDAGAGVEISPRSPTKRITQSALGGLDEEQMSEWNSEDSNWEVVDFKCPVCSVDDVALADQMIPCSICSQQYHTTCAGLRRIPFTTKSEKDKDNRDKYVRKHFQDWRCESCIACAADLNDVISDGGGAKFSSKSSLSSVGSETLNRSAAGRDDASTIASSSVTVNAPQRSAHAMSTPSSRQTYGVASAGGGVIVTDAVRVPVNPTGQPFNPIPSSSSASAIKSKGKVVSLLFPNRNASDDPSPPSSTLSSTPRKPGSTVSEASAPVLASSQIMSPHIKSKNDQVATLLGMLASHGLNAEDLIGMPEAKQKETLAKLMTSSSSDLSNSNISTSGNSDTNSKEERHQDLASALKGLVAKSATQTKSAEAVSEPIRPFSADVPASANNTETVFDARSAMLDVIRRKAQQASAASSSAPSPSTAPAGYPAAGFPGSANHSALDSRAVAKSGVAAPGAEGLTINTSEFAKYCKMVKVSLLFICLFIADL